MRVLIAAVNYNSYSELKEFVQSIYNAVCQVNDVFVDLAIADNSLDKQYVSFDYVNPPLNISWHSFNNVGYFGAAQSMINTVPQIDIYDYVIISNVDLTIEKDFFKKLLAKIYPMSVAWVAPSIYSEAEKRNKNPKVLHRYSKKRLTLLCLMYKYPILHKLYVATIYRRKSMQNTNRNNNSFPIYAGHGSFIILTRSYFASYRTIEYPMFLFGEELYLAEQIHRVHKSVVYDSSLLVNDSEHVSTSKIVKKSYYNYNYQSLTYILKKYYE